MGKCKDYETSDFYCTQCGNKGIPIVRKNGKFREAGHLKRLYCLYCGTETNHCEIRPIGTYRYEDFKEEFELGRFLPDGQRLAVADLLHCSNTQCEYNKHGNCWNSNYSYNCKHRVNEEMMRNE